MMEQSNDDDDNNNNNNYTNGNTPPHPTALAAIIAPSLLSCDLSKLADEARTMIEYGADWMHMDIMDGHFVPNLTFGPPVIASLRLANKNCYIDCHLMVTHPRKWIEPLRIAGASSITFHIESILTKTTDNDNNNHNNNHNPSDNNTNSEYNTTTKDDLVMDMIHTIRTAGMNVGIVIKPSTSVDVLFPYIPYIDVVLIMTVEPGFSGQAFMKEMIPKISTVREKFPYVNIQVDGGIGPSTIECVAEAGANVIVAASAIFGSTTPKHVIDTLRSNVDKYILLQEQEQNKKLKADPLTIE